MNSKFLFNFSKLLILVILFLTIANAAFVAKPLILVILPSISMILVLQSVFLTRPLVSRILLSIFDL